MFYTFLCYCTTLGNNIIESFVVTYTCMLLFEGVTDHESFNIYLNKWTFHTNYYLNSNFNFFIFYTKILRYFYICSVASVYFRKKNGGILGGCTSKGHVFVILEVSTENAKHPRFKLQRFFNFIGLFSTFKIKCSDYPISLFKNNNTKFLSLHQIAIVWSLNNVIFYSKIIKTRSYAA